MLSTILVQTVFLALFIWYTVESQRRTAEVRTRERMVQQLNRLGAACSAELSQQDMTSVHNTLELARIAPTIDVARVTDLAGRTLAVTDNGRGVGLDAPEERVLATAAERQQIFRIKNDQLEAVTPVLREGKPVALLWLEPNHALGLSTTGIVVRIAMTYGGFALLANLLPMFLVVRSITRPLHRLRAATGRVMEGPNLNTGFPLAVTTKNEAGQLTESFNSMVGELEEQRRGLLETLALLNSMLSNAPIGFAFFDRDLRYVRVNEFLAGLHGLPVEEHLGRTPREVYPPSVGEAKVEALRQVFETGERLRNVELAGEMPQAPGVQRCWQMHFYPVRTGREPIRWVGVIVVEITDRLRAEEALRRTEKLAATGRLAASIAHEINNPLEAVTNLLYLLETHEGLNATAAELVMTAQAELSRVAQITQQTLRFYRQSTLPSRANVVEILNAIVMLYQPRIAAGKVVVEKRFRGEPEVFGFGGELRQLFANLIGNALDAMPKGGRLRLSVRGGHGQRTDGMWCPGARITLMDSGVGMAEETRRRIFEAFFTTKEATGTGLGLWVSEEIVRKHGGRVQVRSRQGENSGTSFMIFLPEANG